MFCDCPCVNSMLPLRGTARLPLRGGWWPRDASLAAVASDGGSGNKPLANSSLRRTGEWLKAPVPYGLRCCFPKLALAA